MRIGIDARILAYRRGGISNYIRYLLPALATLDPETDYRVLRHRRDRTRTEARPNLHRVTVWTPCHHRLERWALGVEIARLHLDLLHSPDFIPPAFGARRFIITVHDLNFLYYPQFLTPESRRYYHDQIAWAVARADHILTVSETTRADLIRLLGVSPTKITVTYEGVAPIFRPMPPTLIKETLARYHLSPGYLLFVGTLEPRKNLPGLLAAYRLLLDQGAIQSPLVIVGGKGWLYEDIYTCVRALWLEPHVRFVYEVPDEDLPAIYNGAALLAMPSYYEGFGLPALEALACGTPVIISDRGSLPEVAGAAAVTVNPDDPEDIAAGIARVLNDSDLQAALRAAGPAHAAAFTWEQTAQRTLQVYRQVAGQW
ncbi:MAG: glycosyltransferase family 1 protein, partial [Anaerolineae bacterium]|nr:glycosyltransferase family 1 protein [Anaerolineae bacterium]